MMECHRGHRILNTVIWKGVTYIGIWRAVNAPDIFSMGVFNGFIVYTLPHGNKKRHVGTINK